MASALLAAARASGKPVVVDFIGYPLPVRRLGNLHFASSLGEAAALAVELCRGEQLRPDPLPRAGGGGFLARMKG